MKYLKIKKDAAGNLDDVKVQQADLAGYAGTATNYDTTIGNIKSKFDEHSTRIDDAKDVGTQGLEKANANASEITKIKNGTTAVGKATKLETARSVRTNLASTNAASFDGSANITPGVSGVLPLANGGTGATSLDGANIVTKNTQQTITGQKKFNDYGLVMNDHADFVANDIDINSNPTSEKFAYFNGKDKNGNMLGAIGFYQDPAGNTGAYLQANRGATWGGNLGIKTKAGTSDVFAYAPNPGFYSDTNQIATTYWVNTRRPRINGSITYTQVNGIYAPTSAGSNKSILVSNGSGAPSWDRDFLTRKSSLYYTNALSTGTKSLMTGVSNFSILFISLKGEGLTEHFPFWIPKSEFVGRNSSSNKLNCGSSTYTGNRYINMYYVSDSRFYITSFSGIDALEIWGIA